MTPFDFVNAINSGKKDFISGPDAETLEKAYNPFIVNRAFSFFPDTILYVNELNRYPYLDRKLQFDFLACALRPRKRFSKWLKKEKSDDLEVVARYFNYTFEKARQALVLLSNDQLDAIRKKMNEGGKK